MNRHTKVAFFIAPFLLIGGYIAADYYMEEKAKKRNLFELKLQAPCDLSKNPCVVTNNQLTLTLSNQYGVTQIESNHALEKVVLSFVDKNDKEISYQMKASSDNLFWQSKTQASSLLEQNPELKMRLIGIINKGYYFSEFYSRKN